MIAVGVSVSVRLVVVVVTLTLHPLSAGAALWDVATGTLAAYRNAVGHFDRLADWLRGRQQASAADWVITARNAYTDHTAAGYLTALCALADARECVRLVSCGRDEVAADRIAELSELVECTSEERGEAVAAEVTRRRTGGAA